MQNLSFHSNVSITIPGIWIGLQRIQWHSPCLPESLKMVLGIREPTGCFRFSGSQISLTTFIYAIWLKYQFEPYRRRPVSHTHMTANAVEIWVSGILLSLASFIRAAEFWDALEQLQDLDISSSRHHGKPISMLLTHSQHAMRFNDEQAFCSIHDHSLFFCFFIWCKETMICHGAV